MTIYVVCFFASIILFYYAEGLNFTGRFARSSVFLALLIPCLLAGMRDVSIGTDVSVYAEPMFRAAARSNSFLEFWITSFFKWDSWTYSFVNEYEIGFVTLCYLCAKCFRNLGSFLFLLQALIVIPIYKCLRAFSKTQPVWLGMAVYYLMFFNQTLNMMRQWIAMAFLFYGFQFLANNSNRKYFIVLVMASLFHFTAVLGVAIFVIFRLVAVDNAYNRKIKAGVLVLVGLVSILSLDAIVHFLEILGLKYGGYLSGSLQLMPNQFLYRLPIILLMCIRWKYLRYSDRLATFYLVMIAYDLLAAQLSSIHGNSARIGLFFNEYYILSYPALCASSSRKGNRQIMRWFVICYLCVYWYYTYVYSGSSATVPYVSCISW